MSGRRPATTPEQRREVLALHAAGMRIDIIAERLGMCRSSVYRALKRDVAIRYIAGPGGTQTKHSREIVDRFLKLYTDGVMLDAIAVELGISRTTVGVWSAALGTRGGRTAGARTAKWWTEARTLELIRMKRTGLTNAEMCARLGCSDHALRDQITRVRKAYRARGMEPPAGRPGRRPSKADAPRRDARKGDAGPTAARSRQPSSAPANHS